MQQADRADSSRQRGASPGNLDDVSATLPTRRAMLGLAAGVAIAAAPAAIAGPVIPSMATRALIPISASAVMVATIELRSHQKVYSEETEREWHGEQRRLEDRFVNAQARDARDLARKMRVVLFEDLLADDAAHNAMVFVMAQLERWA